MEDKDHWRKFWLGRWQRGETGWQQAGFEPALTMTFADLAPTRVFVPLCGKSLDMVWLTRQGHEVVGVELSEQGCVAFFEENRIPFEQSVQGPFTVFCGGSITIYCGDFFDLRPEHLGKIGAVYDRAALIALSPELRPKYAARMTELLRATSPERSFQFLQIVLERTPHDTSGPPFSVPAREVEQHYHQEFDVRHLSREPVEAKGPEGSKSDQCVLLMKRR